MANVHAIRSVSNSLVSFLATSYPEELQRSHPMAFTLLSGGELADENFALDRALSLFLFRIGVSPHLRNTSTLAGSRGTQPLALELHYMMTVWSSSAETEQVVMSWAMRHMHQHPMLDVSSLTSVPLAKRKPVSSLTSDGGWSPDEIVHVVPAELSNEDLLRLWDTLKPNYRLSYTYLARVVLLESDTSATGRPVVATRFSLGSAG